MRLQLGAFLRAATTTRTMSHKYIDTHCNIPNILTSFKLLGASNQNSAQTEITSKFAEFHRDHIKDEQLEAIISVASDAESQLDTKLLATSTDKIYGVYGIHPLYAKGLTETVQERIKSYMNDPKTVAWGEIGLDYHDFGPQYDYASRELQKETFIVQMNLAIEAKKPIVIHTREAEQDTLQMMKDHLPRDWPLHVHCFTDTLPFALDLLQHFSRLYIGFTGVITFKNSSSLRAVVEGIPVERLLLETDGPFMTPVPFRGKVCHPGHIPYIAKQIAEFKKMDVSEIYRLCRENTKNVYGI